MKNPRYDGKPMLRLLECYVLKCIGQLSPDQESKLVEMEPGLSQTFGGEGSWFDMISRKMDFAPELSQHLQNMWRQNVSAGAEQTRLSPEHFAQYVVDSNWA